MENASDALRMAFAVFVFIIALSIVFSLISKVKQTADAIMFNSDKTTYYEWLDARQENGRIVGIDTVISTLKNNTSQGVYVKIGDDEFTYTTIKSEIDKFIEDNIKSTDKYLEKIREITIGGEYRIAPDGTKVTIQQGETITYIIYEKI